VKYWKFYILSLAVIILDQAVKMLVHYNMDPGIAGQILIFDDWFKLHYTLNPGMAFGMQIASEHGKLILTIFRLIAVSGIAYYLFYLAKKGVHAGLVWCIALILGGAIGNVIDSTFYGVLLNNAPFDAPTPWFHGQVIDMFYIDIWEGRVAGWMPIFGGDYMALWPIFNIADASIFIGVAIILIWQKSFFKEGKKEGEVAESEVSTEEKVQF
jgi:signal peptidase II